MWRLDQLALVGGGLLGLCALSGWGQSSRAYNPDKPVAVPQSAEAGATGHSFVDKRFHVKLQTPPGWVFTQKDGQISTFHEDARSAPRGTKLRAVAELDFNPFPYSTLAGALFYFSVEPHSSDEECAAQTTMPDAETKSDAADAKVAAQGMSPLTSHDPDGQPRRDVLDIAGMPFAHGHDEHGDICTEARDEVYTTWHKHACYRFDLAINTFCPEASGAQPISDEQLHEVNKKLVGILSTVVLGWEKSGAHVLPVPEEPPAKSGPKGTPMPRPSLHGNG